MLGVNVAPSASDDPRAIVQAGAQWVAITAKPDLPTRDIASYYRGFGLSILLRGDTDTIRGFASPEACAQEFNRRCGDLVQAVSPPISEFDSSGVTSGGGGEAATYPHVKAWHDVWRGRNIPIISPPMTAGQPGVWSDRCNDLVDALGLDLYSPPDAMRGTIGAFAARWKRPVWVLEFPWWSKEHADAALSTGNPAYCYCWRSWRVSDAAYWNDGLLDLNGKPTWRLAEYTALAKENSMPTTDELAAQIATLQRQQSVQTRALAHIGENKLGPGLDTLAADLDELDHAKYQNWKPAPK